MGSAGPLFPWIFIGTGRPSEMFSVLRGLLQTPISTFPRGTFETSFSLTRISATPIFLNFRKWEMPEGACSSQYPIFRLHQAWRCEYKHHCVWSDLCREWTSHHVSSSLQRGLLGAGNASTGQGDPAPMPHVQKGASERRADLNQHTCFTRHRENFRKPSGKATGIFALRQLLSSREWQQLPISKGRRSPGILSGPLRS